MLKVTKFGGSSLADARQFQKVKDIVQADGRRVVVVVSAPGKRFHRLSGLPGGIPDGKADGRLFGL
mgnify:CR=1 FL=1